MDENEGYGKAKYEELPFYLFIVLQLVTYFKFIYIKALNHYTYLGIDDVAGLFVKSRFTRSWVGQLDLSMAAYMMEFAVGLVICKSEDYSTKQKIAILGAILFLSIPYINIYMFLR